MLISVSLFLLLFFMSKPPKNEKTRKKKDVLEERDHWKEKWIRGWVWEVPGTVDGKQKNGGPYLKSTIEIQDPYAKSAAERRGSWKIGNEERRKDTLYRII